VEFEGGRPEIVGREGEENKEEMRLLEIFV